jgi:hypothetical protein
VLDLRYALYIWVSLKLKEIPFRNKNHVEDEKEDVQKRRCVSCYIIKGDVSLMKREGKKNCYKLERWKTNLCSMVSFCLKKDANVVFLLIFTSYFMMPKFGYITMHLEHFQKQIVLD